MSRLAINLLNYGDLDRTVRPLMVVLVLVMIILLSGNLFLKQAITRVLLGKPFANEKRTIIWEFNSIKALEDTLERIKKSKGIATNIQIKTILQGRYSLCVYF